MSTYKRGDVYWYKFMWNGKLVRESTKQGNDKVARQMEAAHRTRLAKENQEREVRAERLGCQIGQLGRCLECEKLFNGDLGIGEGKKFCSRECLKVWQKRAHPLSTLAEFCQKRIEPWARVRPAWLWYRSGIRPMLASKALSSTTLDAVTSETVAAYAARRQADGLAVGSVNRELRVLRRVLRLAVEWGELEKAPKVQMIGGEKRRERVVSDEELARYLTCASPLLADVATLLNDTGLRPDEAHRLDWSDITFVNGAHGNLFVRYGKTAAARRRLPLTPRARALLEARWANAGRPEEGWVFPAPTKTGHIDHSTLKKQHRNAVKLSGVRGFLLYSFRHSFATRIAPHVDAWTLCKIMGWSSLSVAMTYIQASDDRVLEAFSGLEGGHKNGHSPAPQMLTGFSDTEGMN